MSLSDVKKMIQTEKQSEREKNSYEIHKSIRELLRLCEKLEDNDEWQNKTLEQREMLLRQFVYSGEQIYSKTLTIGRKMLNENSRDSGDYITQSLLENRYQISGDKESGFEIITPMLPKKFSSEVFAQTRIMAEIVHEITYEFLKKNSISTPVFTSARIHYEANFGPEIEKKSEFPDGDNLDTKHITDALQQLLFPNDNLMVLSWEITGKRSEKPSFMRITVTDNELANSNTQERI